MRLTAIFPIVCIGISLILSFLALFAGTNNDMLETYDLLTVNTSRIGQDFLKSQLNKTHSSTATAPQSTGNIFSQLIHNATSKVENAADKVADEVEDKLEEDLDKTIASIAKTLGIRDFYSIHIMDHCEGYFAPNGTASRNVTHCSNATGIASFNLTDDLQKQLNASHAPITLPDIHWPDAINDGIHTLELAFNACFVLYTIGIIFTGLAFLLALFALFRDGRLSAFLNIGSCGSAFFFVTIASIITTVASSKATNTINKYGKEINVSATRGDKFVSLTWASVALLIVATFWWVGEFLVGRRRAKMIPKAMQ